MAAFDPIPDIAETPAELATNSAYERSNRIWLGSISTCTTTWTCPTLKVGNFRTWRRRGRAQRGKRANWPLPETIKEKGRLILHQHIDIENERGEVLGDGPLRRHRPDRVLRSTPPYVSFPPNADATKVRSPPMEFRRAPVPANLGLPRRRVPGPLSATHLAVDGEELRISIFVKS